MEDTCTQPKNAAMDPLTSHSCRKQKNLSSKTTPDPATQTRSLKRLPQPRRRTPRSQSIKVELLKSSTPWNQSHAGAQSIVSVFKCTPLRAAAAKRDSKYLRVGTTELCQPTLRRRPILRPRRSPQLTDSCPTRTYEAICRQAAGRESFAAALRP